MWAVTDLEADPCVLSPYAVHKGGYVYVTREGKPWLHHRWVFFQATRQLPEAVMHRCDNPRCININHLVAGTRAENNADRAIKGRSAKSNPAIRIISAAQADWIRKHYVHQRGNKPNPFGVSALARKFGVDTGTIYNILKRKTHL